MRNGKKAYIVINIIIILLTAAWFVCDYKNIPEIFKGISFAETMILFLSVILVHLIKACRLYLVLYGSRVNLFLYAKTYSKVTPVSVVLPFKMGELFRMYCYGEQIGNMFKGIIIILLDRFMDTMALVTAILIVWLICGFHMVSFVYFLIIFLVLVFFLYNTYPSIFKFWKHYLLQEKASNNKLAALKILDTVNTLYNEIESIIKGRGVLLYLMSLIAWFVEIGGLILMNVIRGSNGVSGLVSNYLLSTMTSGYSIDLHRFVVVSVGVMIIFYLVLKICCTIAERKGHDNESDSRI